MIQRSSGDINAKLGSGWMIIGLLFLLASCGGGGAENIAPPPPPTPAPAQATGHFVGGPAGKLFVDDGGKGGLPVVFVHGLGCDHTVWTDQVEHLRRTRRALALDLRGYGKSDPDPKGDYTMEAYAADVAAAAQQLGIPRYVLVGHSMAGAVILSCSAAHPDRVAALVFDDPAGDLTQLPKKDREAWLASYAPETYEKFRDEWFGQMLQPAQPDVREKVLGLVRGASREVVEASARSLATYDPKPALKAYPGPMLAINAPENDAPYSLHRLQPSMKVQVIEGVSHWVMMDKPAEFDAALDEFLKGVR